MHFLSFLLSLYFQFVWDLSFYFDFLKNILLIVYIKNISVVLLALAKKLKGAHPDPRMDESVFFWASPLPNSVPAFDYTPNSQEKPFRSHVALSDCLYNF